MAASGGEFVSGFAPTGFARRKTGLGRWNQGEGGFGVWQGRAGQRELQLVKGRVETPKEVAGEVFETGQGL